MDDTHKASVKSGIIIIISRAFLSWMSVAVVVVVVDFFFSYILIRVFSHSVNNIEQNSAEQ